MSDLLAGLGDEWAPPVWQPVFSEPGAPRRCRDCARTTFTGKHGCGGANRDGIYELCDDCAAHDGRGQRRDGVDDCSRWGIRTDDTDATRLARVRAARQTAHLRRRTPYYATNG